MDRVDTPDSVRPRSPRRSEAHQRSVCCATSSAGAVDSAARTPSSGGSVARAARRSSGEGSGDESFMRPLPGDGSGVSIFGGLPLNTSNKPSAPRRAAGARDGDGMRGMSLPRSMAGGGSRLVTSWGCPRRGTSSRGRRLLAARVPGGACAARQGPRASSLLQKPRPARGRFQRNSPALRARAVPSRASGRLAGCIASRLGSDRQAAKAAPRCTIDHSELQALRSRAAARDGALPAP